MTASARLPASITRPRSTGMLHKTAAVMLRAHASGVAPEAAAKALFGKDHGLSDVLRAVTAPADLTTPPWAGIVAHDIIRGDLIQKITGLSAAAALMQSGLQVDLTGIGSLTVPGRLYDPTAAGGWVAEGQPIRVRTPVLTGGPKLEPRMLKVLAGFTREMVMSSAIVDFTKAAIGEAAAALLDQRLFSTTPADANGPAGILIGAISVPPTAAGTPWTISSDIGALVEALAQFGAGLEPILICAPGQAASLRMWRQQSFYTVLASLALPAGTVVAVEASSFASAIGAVPRFEVGKEMLIHEEDTTPTDIVVSGTPAAPVKSYYQIDAVGLRMTLEAAWGMRNAKHVAIMEGTSW
jgi:hypothetical protein